MSNRSASLERSVSGVEEPEQECTLSGRVTPLEVDIQEKVSKMRSWTALSPALHERLAAQMNQLLRYQTYIAWLDMEVLQFLKLRARFECSLTSVIPQPLESLTKAEEEMEHKDGKAPHNA